MSNLKNFIGGYLARPARSTMSLMTTSIAITYVFLAMPAHALPTFPTGVVLPIPGSSITYVVTTNDSQSGVVNSDPLFTAPPNCTFLRNVQTFGPFGATTANGGTQAGTSRFTATFSAPIKSYQYTAQSGGSAAKEGAVVPPPKLPTLILRASLVSRCGGFNQILHR